MTQPTSDDASGTTGGGPPPVDTPDELTPAWLTDALRAGGLAATVDRVRHAPVGTGQMSGCFRLTLDYARGDGPRHLVAKLPSADPEVRRNGAATYVTEVGFYRDIAPTVSVRAPRCWYAVGDIDRAAFVLLLDDMAPAEPGNQITGCDVEQARAAIVNLAGLHGPRWCDDSLKEITGLAPFGADSAEGIGMGFAMTVEPFIERYATPGADADVLPHVRASCRGVGRRARRPLHARARRLPPRQPALRSRRRRSLVRRRRLAARRGRAAGA